MELYDNIINNTLDLLFSFTPTKLEVSKEFIWDQGKKNEII